MSCNSEFIFCAGSPDLRSLSAHELMKSHREDADVAGFTPFRLSIADFQSFHLISTNAKEFKRSKVDQHKPEKEMNTFNVQLLSDR